MRVSSCTRYLVQSLDYYAYSLGFINSLEKEDEATCSLLVFAALNDLHLYSDHYESFGFFHRAGLFSDEVSLSNHTSARLKSFFYVTDPQEFFVSVVG